MMLVLVTQFWTRSKKSERRNQDQHVIMSHSPAAWASVFRQLQDAIMIGQRLRQPPASKRLRSDKINRPPRISGAFRFAGTLAPFLRALRKPIAIACLRLLTFPPYRFSLNANVPLFLRRIRWRQSCLQPFHSDATLNSFSVLACFLLAFRQQTLAVRLCEWNRGAN